MSVPLKTPAIEAVADRMLARFDRAAPGLAVGLVQNGKRVFAKGYGLADVTENRPNGPNVPMRIASLSKQFLVTLVLTLESEGRLSVGDDIRRYLPDLPDYGLPVTLEDLMSNQSGIRDFLELRLLSGGNFTDAAVEDKSYDLVAAVADLNFEPGTCFAYCNTGFMLLTRVVEALEGKPLEVVLKERLLSPLGMASTGLYRRDTPWLDGRAVPYVETADSIELGRWSVPLDGAGGMISTVDDLMLWAAYVADPASPHAAIFARMRKARPYADGATSIYGLGFTVMPHRGLESFGHHGQLPGVYAEIAWFPGIDATIVLIANTSDMNPFALGRALADAFFADDLAARPEPGAITPGTYLDAARDLVLTFSNDRDGCPHMHSVMTDAVVEWHADGRFRPVWPMLHYDLSIDADGALVGLDGPDVIRLERLKAYTPGTDELLSLAGTYHDPTLGCDRTVRLDEAGLTMEIAGPLGSTVYRLVPLARDFFQARPAADPVGPYRPTVRFAAGTGGTRLLITTDRTRGLAAIRRSD